MKLRPTRLLTLSTVFACIVSESQADEQTIMDLKPVIWLDANHAGDVDLTTAGRVKVWRDRSSNHNDAAVRGDAVPPVWPELIKNVTRGSLSAIRMHSGYLLIKRPLTSNALTVFCALSPARSDESYAILAGQSERGARSSSGYSQILTGIICRLSSRTQ